MSPEDRYDSLIQWAWEQADTRYHFEDADWRLVKAQVRHESGFDPEAVSPVGARGLLQIMPQTWGVPLKPADPLTLTTDEARARYRAHLDQWTEDQRAYERDSFNPEKNLIRGVAHLGYCWSVFTAEVGLERWKFALGAYNCGQGWIIKSQAWLLARTRPTDQWSEIAMVLHQFTGPDNAAQTRKYVSGIIGEYLAARAVG